MSHAVSRRKENDFVSDGGFNLVRHFTAGFLLHTARFGQDRARPLAKEYSAASFRLSFEFRQVCVQLVFRDSRTPLKLLDTAPDLRMDRFPILQ